MIPVECFPKKIVTMVDHLYIYQEEFWIIQIFTVDGGRYILSQIIERELPWTTQQSDMSQSDMLKMTTRRSWLVD